MPTTLPSGLMLIEVNSPISRDQWGGFLNTNIQIINDFIQGLNAVPAGAIMAFAALSVPSGWLRCNGQLVSRTTYATLFGVIGTTYGAGDGVNTFAVPDNRGFFLRGLDEGVGRDTAGAGRTIGSGQDAGMAYQSHSHGVNFSDPGHAHQQSGNNGYGNVDVGGNLTGPTGSPAARWQFPVTQPSGTGISISVQATQIGQGTGNETRPINIAYPYIIKT